MGRVTTPKYRVEFEFTVGYTTPSCWSGAPTPKRFAAYIEALNASFAPGGVNHLAGHPVHICAAYLVEQRTRRIALVWQSHTGALRPDFEECR